MQIHFFSTGQIIQSGLKVEGDESGSIFHDKSSNAVLSATPNFQGNIQIVVRYSVLFYYYYYEIYLSIGLDVIKGMSKQECTDSASRVYR